MWKALIAAIGTVLLLGAIVKVTLSDFHHDGYDRGNEADAIRSLMFHQPEHKELEIDLASQDNCTSLLRYVCASVADITYETSLDQQREAFGVSLSEDSAQ